MIVRAGCPDRETPSRPHFLVHKEKTFSMGGNRGKAHGPVGSTSNSPAGRGGERNVAISTNIWDGGRGTNLRTRRGQASSVGVVEQFRHDLRSEHRDLRRKVFRCAMRCAFGKKLGGIDWQDVAVVIVGDQHDLHIVRRQDRDRASKGLEGGPPSSLVVSPAI